MRILVAHLVGSERSGGMSRLMGRAHDGLEARGHRVTYLTADDVPASMRGGAGRFWFGAHVRRTAIAAERAGSPFDVVNVHEPHGGPIAAIRAGLPRTAVVVMTHGVEQRGWEVALRHGPSQPSFKTRLVHPLTTLWLSRLALTRADHIVCLNTQDREFLRQRFGIDSAKVTPITPGADPFFGCAATGRSYTNVRRLLFAGTWLARKGVHELTAAFNTLVSERADVTLDVVGAGVPDTDVRRGFTPAAAARVRVVGHGNDEMMASVMQEADVFVLPSLFEGTPLTLIEAMWSGLPIVTTRTAGMQDVVEHERTGLLVPPADADAIAASVRRLIAEPGLGRALGEEAHRVAASRYTWPNAAATFETAYNVARATHVTTQS
jgi:glycosyltransferase involved in cell wall biosynthesis